MKLLKRNLKPFYYLLYNGIQPVFDTSGYETGESNISYSPPRLAEGNITDSGGELQINLFGSIFECDKLIAIDDLNLGIDEHSVFFIDTEPTYDSNNNPTYNYIVKKIKKTLNFMAIAVEKVSND